MRFRVETLVLLSILAASLPSITGAEALRQHATAEEGATDGDVLGVAKNGKEENKKDDEEVVTAVLSSAVDDGTSVTEGELDDAVNANEVHVLTNDPEQDLIANDEMDLVSVQYSDSNITTSQNGTLDSEEDDDDDGDTAINEKLGDGLMQSWNGTNITAHVDTETLPDGDKEENTQEEEKVEKQTTQDQAPYDRSMPVESDVQVDKSSEGALPPTAAQDDEAHQDAIQEHEGTSNSIQDKVLSMDLDVGGDVSGQLKEEEETEVGTDSQEGDNEAIQDDAHDSKDANSHAVEESEEIGSILSKEREVLGGKEEIDEEGLNDLEAPPVGEAKTYVRIQDTVEKEGGGASSESSTAGETELKEAEISISQDNAKETDGAPVQRRTPKPGSLASFFQKVSQSHDEPSSEPQESEEKKEREDDTNETLVGESNEELIEALERAEDAKTVQSEQNTTIPVGNETESELIVSRTNETVLEQMEKLSEQEFGYTSIWGQRRWFPHSSTVAAEVHERLKGLSEITISLKGGEIDPEFPPSHDENESSDPPGDQPKSVNEEFVAGLDDIDKFLEEVDPPDELDVGAGGSSMQEVLMGQGSQIVSKYIQNAIRYLKRMFQKRVDEDGNFIFISKEEFNTMKENIVSFSQDTAELISGWLDIVLARIGLGEDENLDLSEEESKVGDLVSRLHPRRNEETEYTLGDLEELRRRLGTST